MSILKTTENASPINTIRQRVLVVDDQEVNRTLLTKILSETYDVLIAKDGAEALDIMRKSVPAVSLALLDLRMPVMDGYAVLKQMQKESTLSKIPVLVVTQKENDEEELNALSLGAIDFLTKPYKAEIIKRKVANTIKLIDSSYLITQVERDGLTGLYNREFFYTYGNRLVHDHPETFYDLICVDANNFKLTNDLYGKEAGDALLKKISQTMLKPINELGGICGRMVADTFLILLPRRTDYPTFLKNLFAPVENDETLSIRIHLYYGIYPINGDDEAPINVMCDRAVLAAKKTKGRYDSSLVIYDDSMRQQLLDEQVLTNDAHIALEKGEFEVFLQPKCDLNTDKLVGAESLIRWNHPTRGLLPPGKFIPIFERNGMVSELDRFVWEETCRVIAQWNKDYGSCVPISVNISRMDIYNPHLKDVLMNFVNRYGIQPNQLHLEVTETVYMSDPKLLIERTLQLKDVGFIIEMDDFGSGYSSLNTLYNLPIDILKLDMKFMDRNEKSKNREDIVRFIMNLSRSLNVPVVAEGVETQNQVDLLKEMGCQYAQGYYYAKPMPEKEFEKLQYGVRMKRS